MMRSLLALGLALSAAAAAFAPGHTTRAAACGACSRPSTPRPRARPACMHAQNATRARPAGMHAQNATLAQIPVDGRRHERMLVELFSALLQTDDVGLLERDAQAMGVAYLDANFSMCRPPLLLRQSVRAIMQRYGLALVPLERKWTPVPLNQSQAPPGLLDSNT